MANQSNDPYRPAAVYGRLLSYARPHWQLFLLALLAMVLLASTDGMLVLLVRQLTNSFVANGAAAQVPAVLGSLASTVSAFIETATSRTWLPLTISLVFVIRAVSMFLSGYVMAYIGQRVVADLRDQVFTHLVRVPVSTHDKSRNADLQAKLTYHASQVADSASSVLTSIIQDGLRAVILVITLLVMSWRLTLILLVLGPVVGVVMGVVNRRFRKVSQRVQSSIGSVNHAADEAITGRRVLKVYGGEPAVIAGFAKLNDYLRRQSLKITGASVGSLALLELIAAAAVSALVWLAYLPSVAATLSPGTFVAFIVNMLLLRQPISSMTGLSERIQRGLVAGADLFQFLDTPVERDTGGMPLMRAHGAIRFDNVHFNYGVDGAREALAGVSLEVPAGKTVAFVGKSGSGKSTLLSLIPRFYDPTAGKVLLDGHDLHDYRLRDLRRQIALVDQNVILFHATIGENIAYGGEQVSRERIEAAASRAYALDFITQQPQGLDTPIGQDGLMLSGGQRQRIAIARALLKDAPILILDEATSALDTESERYIQQALDELKKGRTTLVIAHRLSTIQDADLIVVMDQGRVAETGTHAELLARNGAYAGLHKLQFRDEEEPRSVEGAPMIDAVVTAP
jgi:subfamily B ATP-binding cassette protein MsbA